MGCANTIKREKQTLEKNFVYYEQCGSQIIQVALKAEHAWKGGGGLSGLSMGGCESLGTP